MTTFQWKIWPKHIIPARNQSRQRWSQCHRKKNDEFIEPTLETDVNEPTLETDVDEIRVVGVEEIMETSV